MMLGVKTQSKIGNILFVTTDKCIIGVKLYMFNLSNPNLDGNHIGSVWWMRMRSVRLICETWVETLRKNV